MLQNVTNLMALCFRPSCPVVANSMRLNVPNNKKLQCNAAQFIQIWRSAYGDWNLDLCFNFRVQLKYLAKCLILKPI